MKKKIEVLICCLVFSFLVAIFFYSLGKEKAENKIVYVDFSTTELKAENLVPKTKYVFMPDVIAAYIKELSAELDLDTDMCVSILMVENPDFNPDAIHRNDNGTIDVGLWQLNDRYLYTTFQKEYFTFPGLEIEIDPFNWKINTYIALHHIQFLENKLKTFDDVICGYNAGIGNVLNSTIPESTKTYLKNVKTNYFLLKGLEND